MARVFISHAASDLAAAIDIQRWLTEDNHETFLDRDLGSGIDIGDDWEQRLHERLRWADAVVCVVSKAYVDSVWCSAEVGIARSRGIRLLPLVTESSAHHPLLKSLQQIKFFADQISGQVALIGALRRIDAVAGKQGWPDDRSPFPGLRPFDSDQHRVFFGRHSEAKDLVELLRSPAVGVEESVLLVVGPSGCGKSSLVRAGVLPLIAQEPDWWTLPAVTPGRAPVAALVRQLVAAGRSINQPWTHADIRSRVNDGELGLIIDELLVSTPERPASQLLIIIDQYEELLTQADQSERRRFVKLEQSVLEGPARIVGTLRSGSLEQLLTASDLAKVPHRVHPLLPLKRDALVDVVKGPAEVAGIKIDDDLTADLVADTETGEALPLLAYTLSELADGVTRGGRLQRSHFDLLGGVRGALIRQADAALRDAVIAIDRSPEHVISYLLRLVTLDDTGRPTRWRIEYNVADESMRRALDAFVARRLLTTDVEGGRSVIGVSHEAFLSAWPPLDQAIKAHSLSLRAKKAVETVAVEWISDGRPDSRLWERGQLAAALSDLERRHGQQPGRAASSPTTMARARPMPIVSSRSRKSRSSFQSVVALSPAAESFLRASMRRDRRTRRRSTTILSLLLLGAITGFAVALNRQLAAEEQQRFAIARQLITQADSIQNSDAHTALMLRIAAHEIDDSSRTRSSLTKAVVGTRYESRIAAHANSVNAVAFAPNSGILATGDASGVIILWDISDQVEPRQIGPMLAGHHEAVSALAFAPHEKVLATAGIEGQLIVWDVNDPTMPRRISNPVVGHGAALLSLAWAPDGRSLVTGNSDHTAELWDLTNLANPHASRSLTRHIQEVEGVAFSPDGRTVATASRDGGVLLWDVSVPSNPTSIGSPFFGDTSPLHSIAFVPNSQAIATASDQGNVYLWNIEDLAAPRQAAAPLAGSRAPANSVTVSSDGKTLAAGDSDGASIVWDITNVVEPRRLEPPLAGHLGPILSAAFSPDGRTIATASADHTVALWDIAGEVPHRILDRDGSRVSSSAVAAGPRGEVLATGDLGGATQLWSVFGLANPHRLDQGQAQQTSPVTAVEFSPDMQTMLTGGADGVGILWDVSVPERPRRRTTPLNVGTASIWAAAFSPNGRILAVASGRTVTLWDVTTINKPSPLRHSITTPEWVGCISFSPNGQLLATSSFDGSVALWDLTNREDPSNVSRIFQSGRSQVLFLDDRTLMATRQRAVDIWNVEVPGAPRLLSSLSGLTSGNAPTIALHRSHGNAAYDVLVTGVDDGAADFWDISAPTEPQHIVHTGGEQTGATTGVDISQDGRLLVTVDDKKTIKLWDLRSLAAAWTSPQEAACAITGRGLGAAEWLLNVPGLPFRDTCSP